MAFGIKTPNGNKLLRYYRHGDPEFDLYLSNNQYSRPVMVQTAREADLLMQDMMVSMGDYSLVVVEFTREDEETILVNTLKGYYFH